jgi:putative membrane protein
MVDNRAASVGLDKVTHLHGGRIRRRGGAIHHNEVAPVLSSVELWLPAVNAALIVISGIFLTIGYVSIRTRRIIWHRRCMLTASVFAAAFLIVYVARYVALGSKIYPGDGVSRVVYLVILVSHIVIAIAVAPLAYVTLRRALAGRFRPHRQIARITLPLWIYTAVTGWVVYMLLYVMG